MKIKLTLLILFLLTVAFVSKNSNITYIALGLLSVIGIPLMLFSAISFFASLDDMQKSGNKAKSVLATLISISILGCMICAIASYAEITLEGIGSFLMIIGPAVLFGMILAVIWAILKKP